MSMCVRNPEITPQKTNLQATFESRPMREMGLTAEKFPLSPAGYLAIIFLLQVFRGFFVGSAIG